jgi:hypothetical protein
LKRKSYFVDEHALKRAKKALGVKTKAEAIRLSVEQSRLEEFWKFMKNAPFSQAGQRGENSEMTLAILHTGTYIDHWAAKT